MGAATSARFFQSGETTNDQFEPDSTVGHDRQRIGGSALVGLLREPQVYLGRDFVASGKYCVPVIPRLIAADTGDCGRSLGDSPESGIDGGTVYAGVGALAMATVELLCDE